MTRKMLTVSPYFLP